MTDKEIIQALECCINDDCDNCPDTFGNCEHNAMRNALDLINRQQAELNNYSHNIKNLTKSNMQLQAEIERSKNNNKAIMQTIADVHTEAIKEYKEKLKEHAYLDSGITGFQEMVVDLSDIEKIADEMVGE